MNSLSMNYFSCLDPKRGSMGSQWDLTAGAVPSPRLGHLCCFLFTASGRDLGPRLGIAGHVEGEVQALAIGVAHLHRFMCKLQCLVPGLVSVGGDRMDGGTTVGISPV